MTDKKISALPASTTPLSGTEVLPLVQSSTTVKVAVNDLTAGRNVSTGVLSSYGSATTGAVRNSQNVYGGGSNTNDGVSVTYLNAGITSWQMGSSSYISDALNYRTQWSLKINSGSTTTSLTEGLNVSNTLVTVPLQNVKIGTAAKGIDFSANTPAAGMTSQLLNWYEEGNWTPTAISYDGVLTVNSAKYEIGRAHV